MESAPPSPVPATTTSSYNVRHNSEHQCTSLPRHLSPQPVFPSPWPSRSPAGLGPASSPPRLLLPVFELLGASADGRPASTLADEPSSWQQEPKLSEEAKHSLEWNWRVRFNQADKMRWDHRAPRGPPAGSKVSHLLICDLFVSLTLRLSCSLYCTELPCAASRLQRGSVGSRRGASGQNSPRRGGSVGQWAAHTHTNTEGHLLLFFAKSHL